MFVFEWFRFRIFLGGDPSNVSDFFALADDSSKILRCVTIALILLLGNSLLRSAEQGRRNRVFGQSSVSSSVFRNRRRPGSRSHSRPRVLRRRSQRDVSTGTKSEGFHWPDTFLNIARCCSRVCPGRHRWPPVAGPISSG